MLIGLVGTICAGKTEASIYLQETHNFLRLATGDEVIVETKARNLDLDRAAFQKLGEKLESEFPGYWSRRIIARMIENKNYVVEGLRYPNQIKEFQSVPDFRLLRINAPKEIRKDRYNKRGRIGDINFTSADENDRFKMQKTDDCLDMAEGIYENLGDIEDMYRWLDSKLEESKKC